MLGLIVQIYLLFDHNYFKQYEEMTCRRKQQCQVKGGKKRRFLREYCNVIFYKNTTTTSDCDVRTCGIDSEFVMLIYVRYTSTSDNKHTKTEIPVAKVDYHMELWSVEPRFCIFDENTFLITDITTAFMPVT